jgi:hypothetical protein
MDFFASIDDTDLATTAVGAVANCARLRSAPKKAMGSFGEGAALAAKAFVGGAALKGAQALIDTSTRIDNALKVAGVSGEQLNQVYASLYDSAQKNAAPLESLVQLYGRGDAAAAGCPKAAARI